MASDTPGYISPAQMFPDSFLSLAEDGFIFLQVHAWSEVQTENDFNASVAVAKAILRGTEQKPDVMSRTFDEVDAFPIACKSPSNLACREIPDKC